MKNHSCFYLQVMSSFLFWRHGILKKIKISNYQVINSLIKIKTSGWAPKVRHIRQDISSNTINKKISSKKGKPDFSQINHKLSMINLLKF